MKFDLVTSEAEICQGQFGNQHFQWAWLSLAWIFLGRNSKSCFATPREIIPCHVWFCCVGWAVTRAEGMVRVDVALCSLCLTISSACTYSEVVICGRKTKHIPGRPYLMWKKCSDRAAQLKQDLFTARTLRLKRFGFVSYFPSFFAGCGINSLVFLPLTRQVFSCCSLRLLFLKKYTDFPTAARFPEMSPVWITWKFTVSNVLVLQNIRGKEGAEQRLPPGLHPWKLMKLISLKVLQISLVF